MSTKNRTPRRATKAKSQTPGDKTTKFVMVTFGKSHEAVAAAFEERARKMGWSRSALAREIIRQYFGFSTHLPK